MAERASDARPSDSKASSLPMALPPSILENSSIIFETVPLFSKVKPATHLQRIASKDAGEAHDRRKAASAGTKSRADVDIFSADMERERELSAREAAEDLIGGHTAQFQALKLDEEDNE